jgi:hypothetical protein
MGRTQPVKDGEFIAWARHLDAQCTECKTKWGLDPSAVQKLNTLTQKAIKAYEKNLDISTCNRVSQAAKNAGIAALRQFLRGFIYVLRANESIGEDEIEAMGLPPRVRRTRMPLPPPDEAPGVSIESRRNGLVKVYVQVPQYGHPTESQTRKAYHGFVVRYRKEGDTEWSEKYTTRLHTDISFDGKDTGQRFELMAAWINPRLQHGPWSHELSGVIN